MRCTQIVLAVLCVTAASATLVRADEIVIDPARDVGTVWLYDVTLDLIISEEVDGATEMGRIVQAAHVRLEGVRKNDDGGLVVQGRFDHLTSVWRRGDMQHEFSWKRGGENDGAEEHEPEDAVEPRSDGRAFRDAYTSIVRRPFELTVSNSGGVSNVAGFGQAVQVVLDTPGLDSSTLGMFLPDRFGEALAPIWSADDAAGARSIDDEWVSKRAVDLGPAGEFGFETTWSLDAASRGNAECSANIAVAYHIPEARQESQPVAELLRGGGTAIMVWSLEAQRLERRRESVDMTTRWTLGDLSVTIRQLARRGIERLDSEE